MYKFTTFLMIIYDQYTSHIRPYQKLYYQLLCSPIYSQESIVRNRAGDSIGFLTSFNSIPPNFEHLCRTSYIIYSIRPMQVYMQIQQQNFPLLNFCVVSICRHRASPIFFFFDNVINITIFKCLMTNLIRCQAYIFILS